jgi:hypothetical protein
MDFITTKITRPKPANMNATATGKFNNRRGSPRVRIKAWVKGSSQIRPKTKAMIKITTGKFSILKR